MKCNRPDINLLLSDYFTGHLDVDDCREVEAHLKECRPCRISLRTMALIADKPEPLADDASARHFSPTLLSRYHGDVQSLDPRLVERIEGHLQECDECSADLEFLKNSEIDLRTLVNSARQSQRKPGWLQKLKGLFKRGH